MYITGKNMAKTIANSRLCLHHWKLVFYCRKSALSIFKKCKTNHVCLEITEGLLHRWCPIERCTDVRGNGLALLQRNSFIKQCFKLTTRNPFFHLLGQSRLQLSIYDLLCNILFIEGMNWSFYKVNPCKMFLLTLILKLIFLSVTNTNACIYISCAIFFSSAGLRNIYQFFFEFSS